MNVGEVGLIMQKIDSYFYKNRVTLNVLASNIENAQEIYEATEGNVLIGVLSKNYSTVQNAVKALEEFDLAVKGAVSVGLGAGDQNQSAVVEEIVKSYKGKHINQTFTSVGATRAHTKNYGSWINSLVRPTGKIGYVNISTGPISSETKEQAIIPIKSAISLSKDMGGDAIKYFPMEGLTHEQEFRAVAKACAEEKFSLEPTGGITLENFEEILSIALKENIPKVIPHIYSSIINKDTGETNIKDIKTLFSIVKRLVNKYN